VIAGRRRYYSLDEGEAQELLRRFGAQLRAQRRATRTLDLAARDAGVSFSTVAKIETGDLNARVTILVNVTDACLASLAQLLDAAEIV
jgi:predicted transcriptional regulator